MRQICIIKCSQSYDEIHEVAQIIGQYNRLHRKCRAEFFHFRHFLLGHAGYIPHTHTRTHTSKRNTQETFTKRQENERSPRHIAVLFWRTQLQCRSQGIAPPHSHTHTIGRSCMRSEDEDRRCDRIGDLGSLLTNAESDERTHRVFQLSVGTEPGNNLHSSARNAAIEPIYN